MQPRDEHRQTSSLARGDFLKPTKLVQPGVPGFLNRGASEQNDSPITGISSGVSDDIVGTCLTT